MAGSSGGGGSFFPMTVLNRRIFLPPGCRGSGRALRKERNASPSGGLYHKENTDRRTFGGAIIEAPTTMVDG